MDVPGLGQERYQNFDELYTYCYRVAGTVGLMTLPILGAAEGTCVQYVYNYFGMIMISGICHFYVRLIVITSISMIVAD